jgi:hypothetical protein
MQQRGFPHRLENVLDLVISLLSDTFDNYIPKRICDDYETGEDTNDASEQLPDPGSFVDKNCDDRQYPSDEEVYSQQSN